MTDHRNPRGGQQVTRLKAGQESRGTPAVGRARTDMSRQISTPPGKNLHGQGCGSGGCGKTKAMVGDWVQMQPWLTLRGDASIPDVIQPARNWLKGLDFTSYAIQVDILEADACTLFVETAATVEGPWTTCQAFTQAGIEDNVLSSEGGGSDLVELVRWRVDMGAAEWTVCFKITALPATAAAKPVLTPRRA